MKHFNFYALAVSISLIFASCSTNENLVPEDPSLNLLKTYTIKKDASGAYSLDYILNDNAEVENIKDVATKTNNIYLYPSNRVSKKQISQNLSIDEDQLSIGFIDINADNQPKITIIDDNIFFAKGSTKGKSMLSEYSIQSNEDGTYNLDFTVTEKVDVDFVYNEADDIYEVHLERGNGGEVNFERTFTKNEGSDLKIDFVNHFTNDNISAKAESLVSFVTRKPRTVISSFID